MEKEKKKKKKTKKTDWIDLIIKIIIWIFAVILIYMLIKMIFGLSPSMDDMQNIVIGIMMAMLLSMNYKLGKIDANLNNLNKQFQSLASDFKEHITHHKKK